MKKYIPLLIAAAIFAGCSGTSPAAQPEVFAEPVDTIITSDVTTEREISADMLSSSDDTSVSVNTDAPVPLSDETSSPAGETSADESSEDETSAEGPSNDVSPAEEPESEETAVTYADGSPRFTDPEAIRDVEMTESRRYLFTDDQGENDCGPGEVIHYAKIPLGDDMPECIEMIDIDTDEHVGFMYDDGNKGVNGDETAGDGIYSIRVTYALDKGKAWSRCYFALYTDSEGNTHTAESLTFVNIQNTSMADRERFWEEATRRIALVTSSDEYFAGDIDTKQQMLLDELELLADEGIVYRELTRVNESPRTVVFKVTDGPTVVIELEVCGCNVGSEVSNDKLGLGYNSDLCDGLPLIGEE